MNLANKFTLLRVILAPVFFVIYLLPVFFPELKDSVLIFWSVPVIWIIAVFAELTDMFDGMAARKLNETSDFGKLFDPFADTLFQITVFLCFVIEGVFPAALFLLVLYREFGILFIRNLMLKKGVTMGARISGKVKTVTYITAGAAALFAGSIDRLGVLKSFYPAVETTACVIFIISVVISIVSFIDYVLTYRKTEKV